MIRSSMWRKRTHCLTFLLALAAVTAVARAEDAVTTVVVTLPGRTLKHGTTAATVRDVLGELGLPVSGKLVVRPGLDTPLTQGLEVVLPRLEEDVMTFPTALPAPLKVENRYLGPMDDEPEDRQVVVDEGKPGRGVLQSTYYFQDGDLIGYKEHTVVEQAPQPRVVVRYEGVAKGRPVTLGQFLSDNFKENHRRDPGYEFPMVGAPPEAYRQKLTMEATAYTPHDPGVNFRTSLGWRLRHGIVAVDPREIPLGTKVYVEGYGYGVAADVGSAIKGNKIDLAFFTLQSAYQFGRRQVNVYLLD